MKRVAILGAGLIGGSVGLALKSGRPQVELVGYDSNPASTRAALDRGALDHTASSVEEAVAGADLVLLCMPVDQIPQAMVDLAPFVRDGA
ncbi:MAG TPA: prephenate dehydrogenase/arogenate dehydrogenase family protein, partial [Actinomycetota bacterium]|nr:prephenate dehydrogenase/arogenate dehydrogenase family protein [Actinomycetota bacterium]